MDRPQKHHERQGGGLTLGLPTATGVIYFIAGGCLTTVGFLILSLGASGRSVAVTVRGIGPSMNGRPLRKVEGRDHPGMVGGPKTRRRFRR